jgi:periplasmic divalent cation tolerance protein
MSEIVFLYATAPEEATAMRMANALVEKREAACVNVIPGMTSVYRWKGAIETAQEMVVIVKTTADMAERAKNTIVDIHPYDTPCVVALKTTADASHRPFLDWISSCVS